MKKVGSETNITVEGIMIPETDRLNLGQFYDRRLAVLRIDPQQMIVLLTSRQPFLASVLDPIPRGAVCVGLASDPAGRWIDLYLEHEDFETVPRSGNIPILPSPQISFHHWG